ncbi:post-transcriptional regulator [Sutcliffiella rhizosphaerae]|uniref:Post-transcriptional regulator ComN n=1 Tax=Sutcliffiella rhizosphaerae TaxID=2880967 RepID=A0ABN8A9Y4_9BACI|nr:post-transcriptional regulator [Sutcliffiella rhizosphaerae]CAG9619465.1 Post-transcriptional regulator ComN [Sutcliffiella rhizosphaerae]
MTGVKATNQHAYDLYRYELNPVLQSKLEEFQLLGYNTVSENDLWECLTKKKWKRPETKMLYELVNDVYSLSLNEYMTFITIEAYKAPNFFVQKDD